MTSAAGFGPDRPGTLEGSTTPPEKVTTMAVEPLVEVIELDLLLMGSMPGMDHDDGGQVVFSTKELLVDLRNGVQALGEKIDGKPSKEDLDRIERKMDAEHVEIKARVAKLELAEVDNRLKWARLFGVALGAGALSGGTAAGVLRLVAG